MGCVCVCVRMCMLRNGQDSYFFIRLFSQLALLNESFSGSSVVKSTPAHAEDVGDKGSIPGLARFPWKSKWQPTPVFLPGKSHRQRSLEGCSLWVCKELDTTEHISTLNENTVPLLYFSSTFS